MNKTTFFGGSWARGAMVAVLVGAIVGCGGSNGGSGGPTASGGDATGSGAAAGSGASSGGGGGAPDAPDLSGQWSSGCVAVPASDGSTQYLSLSFDIDAARWSLDYRVHGDDACSSGFLTVHIDGPYELVAPSEVALGAWNAIFSFDEKTVTPESDAATGFLGSLGACGSGAFMTGVPADVLTDGCAGLGQYPGATCPADYDLVRKDGSELHFGQRPADNDMCSADKRPTELSTMALTRTGG